ncbi:hypothetical protein LT330_010685 [Penicillium expansum]|nr:hypothetical protein LT330_010685 [Penicillium expansum]
MTREELYLFNSRDQMESDRLDTQHSVLAGFMGYKFLHPSIDLRGKGALKVADVGTGTGIWLRKLSPFLQPLPEGQSHHLHGFDISNNQFPIDTNGISFSTHDATKCFPEEHLNSYDIVHVRLFVFALQEPDIRKVMENVVQLLRPGGYLQWEDADFCYAGADRPAPTITEIIRMVTEYSIQAGFSMRISECLTDQGKRLELQSLNQYGYGTLEKPECYTDVKPWFSQLLRALLPVTLIRTGRASNQLAAQALTCQMLEDVESEYSQGVIPRFQIMVIVGRRPSESV